MAIQESLAGGLEWYGLNLITHLSSEIFAQVGISLPPTQQPNFLLELIEAFILGIVQGLTEFLPISSTAHLEVFTKVFGWASLSSKAFLATIQFGSVIAVLMYFWTDISHILKGGLVAVRRKDWRRGEWQLLVGIAVGTLPILVVGFLIKAALNNENSSVNSMTTIACASIVMALLLGAAEKFGSRKRDFSEVSLWDGLLMGLGQMLALVPGVSRSGSTITTGLFLGLERNTAARFSFLLGIPSLTIATLYQFFKEALGKIDLLVVAVGTASAFIFSYLSISWLLRHLQTQSNWIFVWYRLSFGAAILSAIAAHWLPNN